MIPLKDACLRCLRSALRPLVRLAVRSSCTIQDLVDVLKPLLVEEAVLELTRSGAKITTSRLSAMTGLQRAEIDRIYRHKLPPHRSTPHVITRVIGQWQSDKRFRTSSGTPKVLSVEGDRSEFKRLVGAVSSNLNPATILFELERIGAAARVEGGVTLVEGVNRFGGDPERIFDLLSRDMGTMIDSVRENVTLERGYKNLHIRTEYDNLVLNKLPEIRQWFLDEGIQFHKRAREYLSQFDQDLNPDPTATGGGRAVIQAFSWTSDDEFKEK